METNKNVGRPIRWQDAVRAILMLARAPGCIGKVYNLPGCRYASTPALIKSLVRAAARVEEENDSRRAECILQNGFAVQISPTDRRGS